MRPDILVAGLGNLLMRDDGVGVHAVRRLRQEPPHGALVVEVGTAVLDALHLLEEAEKVLAIDAIQAGGEPGTLYAARVADLEARAVPATLHEMDLLSVLPLLRRRPEIVILGVEAETVEFGMSLSPRVEAAVPEVVRHVREAVARWRSRPCLMHNAVS